MEVITGIDPKSGNLLEITIENGRIASMDARPHTADDDAPLFVAPGLIDLQVNGFGGLDLNNGDLTADTVGRLARLLLTTGVTRFLPTIITASEHSILSAVAAISAAMDTDRLVAGMVAGIHVEGPFLSPEDGPRGAHPRDQIRPPDLSEVDRWQAACRNRITMVTVSPHWTDAPSFVAALAGRGIHVAIGHTDATAEQIRAAVDAGAVLSTHLGNGSAAMLPRHPNFLWAQLADDRLTAAFVADGHHLPADTLKAMIRAKGIERSVLVSDTAALGGMAPGIYDQPIGGRVALSEDGRLSLAGTPYLAGAARCLAEDVAIAADMAGLTLADALRMATENAGKFAGGSGRLGVGEPADIIRFAYREGDRRLAIADVWLRGRRVFP